MTLLALSLLWSCTAGAASPAAVARALGRAPGLPGPAFAALRALDPQDGAQARRLEPLARGLKLEDAGLEALPDRRLSPLLRAALRGAKAEAEQGSQETLAALARPELEGEELRQVIERAEDVLFEQAPYLPPARVALMRVAVAQAHARKWRASLDVGATLARSLTQQSGSAASKSYEGWLAPELRFEPGAAARKPAAGDPLAVRAAREADLRKAAEEGSLDRFLNEADRVFWTYRGAIEPALLSPRAPLGPLAKAKLELHLARLGELARWVGEVAREHNLAALARYTPGAYTTLRRDLEAAREADLRRRAGAYGRSLEAYARLQAGSRLPDRFFAVVDYHQKGLAAAAADADALHSEAARRQIDRATLARARQLWTQAVEVEGPRLERWGRLWTALCVAAAWPIVHAVVGEAAFSRAMLWSLVWVCLMWLADRNAKRRDRLKTLDREFDVLLDLAE